LFGPFMMSRPIIFTLPIILAGLYSIECYIQNGSRKHLFVLPILSLLLINLHAAMWPILFILLLPFLIDSFRFKIGPISGQGFGKKNLFFVIVLMLIAGFAIPTDSKL
jgi:hypothetical protein